MTIRLPIILMIYIIIFNVGTFGWLKPGNDPSEIWFQRMGAILVVLSIYSEILTKRYQVEFTKELKNIREHLLNREFIYIFKLGLAAITSETMVHSQLVLGTIIWGYGDLIYRFFNT
jgi:hypothetical protein